MMQAKVSINISINKVLTAAFLILMLPLISSFVFLGTKS
jgi:positive regulator of sigma E activity